MSRFDPWMRAARRLALLSLLATPGCLAEVDDPEGLEPPAETDQALDPGPGFELIEEPSLELMAEGHRADVQAWSEESLDEGAAGGAAPRSDGPVVQGETTEEGEPTPQPWRQGVAEDPGDEGGPDPVPWEVVDLGPDPVPWRGDDDIEASTGGQTEDQRRYDPH